MPAGYWFVQRHRIGAREEAEERCADCREVVEKINQFRSTNRDPNVELRVHVPSHATDDECRQVDALRVKLV